LNRNVFCISLEAGIEQRFKRLVELVVVLFTAGKSVGGILYGCA
jgi:hypothetical protein